MFNRFAAFAAVLAAIALAQTGSAPPFKLTTYYLCLLRKGPAWSAQETPQSKRIQEGHMANVRRLISLDKLVLAGPVTDKGDLRGVFVLKAASIEEAKALCETDPAIRAGHMKVELHPWMSAEGITFPERDALMKKK